MHCTYWIFPYPPTPCGADKEARQRLSRAQRAEIYALNAVASQLEAQRFARYMEHRRERGGDGDGDPGASGAVLVGSDSEDEDHAA